MKILLIGNGAREHCIAWKILQSPLCSELIVAPGNPGTEEIAENVDISIDDTNKLYEFAISSKFDLVIIGPEAPIEAGLSNLLIDSGIKVFGPTKEAGMLETSKSFAKTLMKKNNIPTAKFEVFTDIADAKNYLDQIEFPVVIKADGLASGKGVVICNDRQQSLNTIDMIMKDKKFGDAGKSIVIEEFLTGQEISVFSFTDGENFSSLVAACDYKKLFDSNLAPNTGGMGAFSPPKSVNWDQDLQKIISESIISPVIQALNEEGNPYKGILYAGLILTKEGPKVLEFNCRFGDPETQVLLPRLETDLLEIILSINASNLNETKVEWNDNHSLTVVLASSGYPNVFQTGYEISGLEDLHQNINIFHSGTKRVQGKFVTNGGRVLSLSTISNDLASASSLIYSNIDKVNFEGAYYRHDIGK